MRSGGAVTAAFTCPPDPRAHRRRGEPVSTCPDLRYPLPPTCRPPCCAPSFSLYSFWRSPSAAAPPASGTRSQAQGGAARSRIGTWTAFPELGTRDADPYSKARDRAPGRAGAGAGRGPVLHRQPRCRRRGAAPRMPLPHRGRLSGRPLLDPLCRRQRPPGARRWRAARKAGLQSLAALRQPDDTLDDRRRRPGRAGQLAGGFRLRPDDPGAHPLRHAARLQHRRRRHRAAADPADRLRCLSGLSTPACSASSGRASSTSPSYCCCRSFSERDAWSRLAAAAPLYTPARAGAGGRRSSSQSPDPLFSRRLPLRPRRRRRSPHAPRASVPYWSVSVYDRDGDNVYSFNDHTATAGGLDLVIATPGADDHLRKSLPAESGPRCSSRRRSTTAWWWCAASCPTTASGRACRPSSAALRA